MISSDYNKRKHLLRTATGAIIALLLFGMAAGAASAAAGSYKWSFTYTYILVASKKDGGLEHERNL